MAKKSKFNNKEIELIIKLHTKDLLNCAEIARKINSKQSIVYYYLNKYKVLRASKHKGPENRGYDTSFFERIDTEEKAYFLGLLYADGCNHRRGFSISLQDRDFYLIKHLQKILKADKIKIYKVPARSSKHQEMNTLNISCTKMSLDLAKLGCVPKKSLILNFPNENQVPKHLIHHFIRGYFDGDGSINLNGSSGLIVSFTSSLFFSQEIKKLLKKIGINSRIVKRVSKTNNNYYVGMVIFSGTFNALKLYNFMYNNSSIFLNRKKIKFEEAFNKQNFNKNGSKRNFKYKGVRVVKNKNGSKNIWAEIYLNGNNIRLGRFDTELKAAKAYDLACFNYKKDKAILNFPEDYDVAITRINQNTIL